MRRTGMGENKNNLITRHEDIHWETLHDAGTKSFSTARRLQCWIEMKTIRQNAPATGKLAHKEEKNKNPKQDEEAF